MEKNITIKISKILKEIINNYNSLNEFSEKAGISSAYISKLINLKYPNPPTPKILKKISDASKGITSYDELMRVCGYVNENIKFGGNYNKLDYDKILDLSNLTSIELEEVKKYIDYLINKR